MIHTFKGFSIVNEAELGVFLEFPWFLHDPMNVGNLISGSSAFPKPSLYICRFLVHKLLKPSLKDFEHYFETWLQSLGREDPLEKEMAIHSSTLAWKIPWTEEPGRIQSMGSQRVRHDWATSLHFMHWRRKWQPTPVFLPGEHQGWQSLVGCSLCGRTELDTTDTT